MPPRTYKPTQRTRARILQKAIELFNASGSSVSLNALAEALGISAGNLQYHYKTKEEIIRAILEEMYREFDVIYAVSESPFTLDTLRHNMRLSFDIHWKYRFFFRELAALLRNDPLLATRFREIQGQRLEDQKTFIHQMAQASGLQLTFDPEELRRVTLIGWVLASTWLSYIESLGQEIDETTLNEAVEVLVQHYKPYLQELI